MLHDDVVVDAIAYDTLWSSIILTMKIGVLTIGAELLNGSRIDTNASWISNAEFISGGSVVFKMSVPDSESKIIKASELFTFPIN